MKYAVHEEQDSKNKNKKNSKRDAVDETEPDDTETVVAKVEEDDGTDDHIYHPLLELDPAKRAANKGNAKEHADIQSLQESAEIAGKVVLLSRGGCGFLEKVKWVQRRGGKALIVGDDVRGGPLVTMYARGDTSNITVPALFTSYTTAHLLSSLIPSGGAFGTSPVDGNKAGLGKISAKLNKGKDKNQDSDDQPTFTTTIEAAKPTAKPQNAEDDTNISRQEKLKPKRGWLRRFISWIGFGSSGDSDVSRRPPGSGRLDWVMVEEFDDDKLTKSPQEDSAEHKNVVNGPTADNFVIGVHDWRDPDMVPARKNGEANVEPRKADSSKASSSEGQLKGGIITPGSGEYEKPKVVSYAESEDKGDKHVDKKPSKVGDGWLSHLPWKHDDQHAEVPTQESTQCAGNKCKHETQTKAKESAKQVEEGAPKHEGLWVTLTPTNMSSSPFFDTLLVLVVSPLVTLTVVYALLLLRSRIRRRRWRAPKSVVDRLPVRTYHTISSEASTTSLATPNASSPTTPLLQPAPRRVASRSSSRSRPRSRTTSEVPEQGTSSSLLGEHHESPSTAEKRETGLAEWRRRYGGRQKECVVCLEEYVDGVSRVMSLPCGHEFHAECM
jgi:hypothetical protein